MAGFEVYNFLLPGSHVFKKEGNRDIHVLTENKLDGSIKGKSLTICAGDIVCAVKENECKNTMCCLVGYNAGWQLHFDSRAGR